MSTHMGVIPRHTTERHGQWEYGLWYHLLLVTAARKPALADPETKEMLRVLLDEAAEKDEGGKIVIEHADIGDDHAHLIVRCTPVTNIPKKIAQIKHHTSWHLLRWCPVVVGKMGDEKGLWSDLMFVLSTGHAPVTPMMRAIVRVGRRGRSPRGDGGIVDTPALVEPPR